MVFAPRETAGKIGWSSRSANESKDDVIDKGSRKNLSCKRMKIAQASLDDENDEMSTGKMPRDEIKKSLDDVIDNSDNINKDPSDYSNTELLDVKVEMINDGQQLYSIVDFDPSKSETSSIYIMGRSSIVAINGDVNIFGFILTSQSKKSVIVDCPTWMSSMAIKALPGENNNNVKIKVISLDNDEFSYQLVTEKQVQSPIVIDDRWTCATKSIIESLRCGTISTEMIDHGKRIVVCGAKNVGKSTYAKYLCNSILSNSFDKVAFLDCDVGQPELSPPGILSLSIISKPLLCPSHVHMICNSRFESSVSEEYAAGKEHISAIYYGSTTSKMNPILYIDALKVLINDYEELCKKTSETIPLVVNTDGWVKGMGFEILSSIIDTVKPGHIAQLVGSTKAKFFDMSIHTANYRSIHVLLAQSNKDSNQEELNTSNLITRVESSASLQTEQTDLKDNNTISPSTLRHFRVCVYFSGGYSSFLDTGATLHCSGILDDDCKLALRLAQMSPYVVPFHAVACILMDEDGNSTIYSQESPDDHELIYDIFNGSIVGLCSTGTENVHRCFGLGVVRSIDRKRRLFYILTPLHSSVLQNNVSAIVRGQSQLPLECVYLGQNAETFPYQACDGISFGSGEVLKSNMIT